MQASQGDKSVWSTEKETIAICKLSFNNFTKYNVENGFFPMKKYLIWMEYIIATTIVYAQ